jgi:hypothetical protein
MSLGTVPYITYGSHHLISFPDAVPVQALYPNANPDPDPESQIFYADPDPGSAAIGTVLLF